MPLFAPAIDALLRAPRGRRMPRFDAETIGAVLVLALPGLALIGLELPAHARATTHLVLPHLDVRARDDVEPTALQAAIGGPSPTRVTRCMTRRTFTLSKGSTECIVHRLSHMITSSLDQTCR